jgi:hypothetical protein
MQDIVKKAVNEKVWALVGATNDRSKYGNIIFHNMRNAGYTVYPVNPRATTIDGEKAYPSLAELPEKPAVVNVVIPPALTIPVVEEVAKLGIPYIWFQPGAESQTAIERAKELGVKVIYDACAMVSKNMRSWK